jgi:hypothetical protein
MCPHQNAGVTGVTVLRNGAFNRWFGYEERSLTRGIKALLKEASCTVWVACFGQLCPTSKRPTLHYGPLILGFLASRIVREEISVLY